MSSNSPAFGLYNTDAALWTASKHAGDTARIVDGHVFIGSDCLARFTTSEDALATLTGQGWEVSKFDGITPELRAPVTAAVVPAFSPISPGAMRAATALTSPYDECNGDCLSHEQRQNEIVQTAQLIDRETGAGELAEALQNLVDCYGVGWKTTQAFCEAVKPLIEDARATLARYNSAR